MRTWLALSIAAFSLCALSTPAFADADDIDNDRNERFDDSYVAAKLMLGLGGEAEYDAGPTESEDDMLLSYGVGLAYMVPIIPIVALGGQLSVGAWNSEDADDAGLDRNVLADLSFLPQLNIDFSSVELYLNVPLGLTLDFFGSDDELSAQFGGIGSVETSTDVAIGFHFGAMLGARFSLAEQFGLLAELGYVAHSFSHEVEVTGSVIGVGGTDTYDYDVSFGQFALNVGAYF